MLGNPEFYRSDIGENKPGLPLTMTFTLVDVNAECAPLSGLAVEVWHCDAGGFYSEYTTQAGDPNDESKTTFLRGLQRSDEAGKVTFQTIYPGWYAGRAPHVHVIVYRDGKPLKTMQLALPDDVCASVYATGLYAAKGPSPLTNTSDALFKRGDLAHELLALEGDLTRGYEARLTFGVPG